MIFKKIYIQNYRSLNEFTIRFNEFNSFYRSIYKNMNINVIVGENGSGKSSLLSFIATVFHNIERFPERIPCSFEFIYSLHNNKEISLSLHYPILKISSKDEKFCFFLEDSCIEMDGEYFKKTKYNFNLISHLIPDKITLSSFSIDSFFKK